MAWIKIDDGRTEHEKIVGVVSTPRALRPLRAMGLAQCDQHGTWTAMEVAQ